MLSDHVSKASRSKKYPYRKIANLLKFSVHTVPYYRQRKGIYGVEALGVRESFARLPYMTKADVRAHFDDLISEKVDVNKGLADQSIELASTSGTTGERLQVLSDMTINSVPDEYELIWKLRPSEADYVHRTAVFTTPLCMGTQCHLGALTMLERIRGGSTLTLNSTDDLFTLRKDLVQNIADELHAFQPDLLLVNPVYLHWLIRCAKEHNIAIPSPQCVLSCYQYLSQIQRREIEAHLNCPVYNYYFATDLAGCRLGVECHNRRLHVREDHVFVELARAANSRLPAEVGAFSVTAHASRLMPMVRYIVGDVGKLTDEACDCAVGGWQTMELHGRGKDMLLVGDSWLTTKQVDDVMSSVSGLDFYRCVQVSSDKVDVQVIPSLGHPESGLTTEVNERLRAAFGIRYVNAKTVRRLDPEASLKFRLTHARHVKTIPDAP